MIARRFWSSRRGTAAVEFAVLTPLLLLMLAGAFEIGRAFQVQSAVNKLASEYAITWADCVDQPAGVCNIELNQYSSANSTANLAPQLTNPVSVQMFQVAMSGSTASVTYSYPSSSTLSGAQSSAASSILSSGQSGVVVTVNYTHTLTVFPNLLTGIIPSSIPMSFTVVQLKS